MGRGGGQYWGDVLGIIPGSPGTTCSALILNSVDSLYEIRVCLKELEGFCLFT